MKAVEGNGAQHFQTRTVAQALENAAHNAAITRLLEFGALETNYVKVTPELVKTWSDIPAEQLVSYQGTSFGKAILEYTGHEMFGRSPEMQSRLAAIFSEGNSP